VNFSAYLSVRNCVTLLMPNSSTTFLLALFPNLTTLTLPFEWTQDTPDATVQKLLDDLATRSHGSGIVKLHKLVVPGGGDYDVTTKLQNYSAFFALRGLQEFQGCDFVAVEDTSPFDWCYPKLASSLTCVELAYSVITGEQLAKFLAYTPALRIFRYAHQVKRHGDGHDWDAAAVLATLAEHCSDTLTELSITIHSLYGEIEAGISDLRRFSKLQHLELDVQLFDDALEKDERSLWELLPADLISVICLASIDASKAEVLARLMEAGGDSGERVRSPLLTLRRGLEQIGDMYCNPGQNQARWQKAGERIRSAGGEYVEMEAVHAAWLGTVRLLP